MYADRLYVMALPVPSIDVQYWIFYYWSGPCGRGGGAAGRRNQSPALITMKNTSIIYH